MKTNFKLKNQSIAFAYVLLAVVFLSVANKILDILKDILCQNQTMIIGLQAEL